MGSQDPKIRDQIRDKLLAEGFDLIGFCAPDSPSIQQAGAHFLKFLQLGRHGDMGWLSDKASRRVEPKALWPDVRSVIMVGKNYGPDADPLAKLGDKNTANISVYAHGKDYHDRLKGALKRFGQNLAAKTGCQLKVFVDTAPVLEKPLAQAAGLGWQGKHTNLVSQDYGSWLFLGAIFTDLELTPDQAAIDHCGTCHQCLDICPTNAFPAPYQLDAERCLSYLTIELKTLIPQEFRKAMGNRIYGCDDCLAICPWNKFAKTTQDPWFWPKSPLKAPSLADLALLSDFEFRQMFAGSPVKRIGRNKFISNVCIAIGNSADPNHTSILETLLEDPAPIIRAAAVWALFQLLDPLSFCDLRAKVSPKEGDPLVLAEWGRTIP